MSDTTTVATALNPESDKPDEGLQPYAVALIVIGSVILFVLLVAAALFVAKKIRERRRDHGEYRPQFEEMHHAKDLPYLQPPAVEGLI